LQAYRQAQLVMPDEWQWKLGEAYALLALNQAEDAAGLFGELIREQPGNTALWLAQSDAWMAMGEYGKAIPNREYVRRLGKQPNSDMLTLGHLYLDQGLPDPATGCYLEALKGKAAPLDALDALDRLLTSKHWKQAQQVAEGEHSDDNGR
jgi:tetratricopeptide (TPR) repeat protein